MGVAPYVLPHMTLLNEQLDIFLQLVKILHVMTFHIVLLPPSIGIMAHNVRLMVREGGDVVGVEDFTPYLFSTSIERCEVLNGLLYAFEGRLISFKARCSDLYVVVIMH